jgi:hypothetical protein
MDKYEGHEENTAPKTVGGKEFDSPGTFVPLAEQATSVNVKRPEGEKGK